MGHPHQWDTHINGTPTSMGHPHQWDTHRHGDLDGSPISTSPIGTAISMGVPSACWVSHRRAPSARPMGVPPARLQSAGAATCLKTRTLAGSVQPSAGQPERTDAGNSGTGSHPGGSSQVSQVRPASESPGKKAKGGTRWRNKRFGKGRTSKEFWRQIGLVTRQGEVLLVWHTGCRRRQFCWRWPASPGLRLRRKRR